MSLDTGLKVAVIGGGSTYTPELVEGFLHGTVLVREIVLLDPDRGKLDIVGGLAQRMAQAAHTPATVSLTTDLPRALEGADVVITQFRIGGQAARILDERIPLSYGLVGQETTGPGGFAKALRSIPVLLGINREMAARCPDAWLINFTNPSGILSEALRRHGRGHWVGLCNYPLTLKMNVARAFDVAEERVELAYFGLNHLSWARVRIDGVDCTEELIEIIIAQPEHREISGYAFAPERLRALGLIPSGYLRYYYDTEKMVRELREAPQTRGERVREMEASLLETYADPALCTKPAGLQERGGAWYSTAAVRLVHDLWSEDGGRHILNVPNGDALCTLPPRVVVETPAQVIAGTVISRPSVTFTEGRPRVAGFPVPAAVESLIARVKTYELRAVSAAVSGSREEAISALEAHPLLEGRHDIIPRLLDDLLQAHRPHLPQFFRDACAA